MNHVKTLSQILSGVLAAFLFSVSGAHAQGSWEQITSANSLLPSDSVRVLAADSAGNVWAATLSRTSEQGVFRDAGICRFNGSEWSRELDGTTTIWGMITGPNGVLYAVVFPQGESPRLWHRKEGEWKPIPSSQQSTTISGMVMANDGTLFGWETSYAQPWFFLYDPDPVTGEPGGTEQEQWLPSIGEGNYSLTTAGIDGGNALWIVADQYEWVAGEYRRKETPSVLLSISPDNPDAGWQGVNLDRAVTCFAGGRSDVTGFGTTDGFLVHKGNVPVQNWIVVSGVTSAERAAQDGKGNFWIIGTAQGNGEEKRLLYYDVARNRLSNLAPIPYDDNETRITGMAPDLEGNLWIGYNGKGLSVWHPATSGAAPDLSASHDLRITVVPNPARGVSEFRCVVPGPTPMTVEILDAVGRSIRTLYNGTAEAGEKKFRWDGNGYSGSYYCRITTRFGVSTTKFLLLDE